MIQREWVLKKVALCLEQRSAKANRSGFHSATAAAIANEAHPAGTTATSGVGAGLPAVLQQSHMGCIIMGSNGSGKTTICESILDGNIGTRGLLNRRLLGCYFVDSQHPDCHNLSVFLRSLVLQILSHSSHLAPREAEPIEQPTLLDVGDRAAETVLTLKPTKAESASVVDDADAAEEELIAQLVNKSPTHRSESGPLKLVRQQSEPLRGTNSSNNGATPKHSRSVGGAGSAEDDGEEALCDLGSDVDGKVSVSKDTKQEKLFYNFFI